MIAGSLNVPRLVCLVVSVLCLANAEAAAQAIAPDSVPVGSLVRVHRRTFPPVDGRLVAVSSDSLSLLIANGSRLGLPWSDIASLQAGQRRSYTLRGAIIGFSAATAVALVTACCTEYEDPSAGAVFAIGVVVLGLPAAGLGALIGHVASPVQWRTVSIER